VRRDFGYPAGIAPNRHVTEVRRPLEPVPAAPPPDPVPPRLARDVWPWLALFGILVGAGVVVWLFVLRDESKGPVVPAVVGLRQQQAIPRLAARGFRVKAILEPARKPRGIVVSQAPGGGSRLDKGQLVTLHVSNGRLLEVVTTKSPTTTTTTTKAVTTPLQSASVPDTSGLDLVSAAGQVEAAGFVAETRPDDSASSPAGRVSGQDPAAGTAAPVGSVVVLSVATGANRPQVQVPNVVGQKSAAARAAVLGAKLTAKTIYKKGPGKKVGIVLSETPTGAVPAYTQVAITVGS
jgi:beta-lactam-binding protein with PASTA domain